jgi:hypothetical protein
MPKMQDPPWHDPPLQQSLVELQLSPPLPQAAQVPFSQRVPTQQWLMPFPHLPPALLQAT